jgi:hypothetical protein
MSDRSARGLGRGWWLTWAVLTAVAVGGVLIGHDLGGLVLGPALGLCPVLAAALATVRAVAAGHPSGPASRRGSAPGPPYLLPDSYVRVRELVRWAMTSRARLGPGLRALLRDVALDRLAARHGVDLDADPLRARAVVGDELWAVIRVPDPAEAPAPDAPALDLPRLTQRIEDL